MPPLLRPPALVPLVPLLCALLAGCTGGSPVAAPPPTVSATAPATPPLSYVALGDSVAAGVGADEPRSRGYVPLLAEGLRQRLGCTAPAGCPLTARNLAVSGATTATVLQDQLPRLRALQAELPPVRLVTLTAGGNDVVAPVLRACAPAPRSPACAAAARQAVTVAEQGVAAVLSALDDAAPDATVAVMAYYDPLPACRLAALSPLAVQVLEGDGTRDGLNDVLRRQAAAHGDVLVETRALLADRADLVGGSDCLHPSAQGHAELAEAFLAGVAERVLPG